MRKSQGSAYLPDRSKASAVEPIAIQLEIDRHHLLLIMRYKVPRGTDTSSSSMQGCLRETDALYNAMSAIASNNVFIPAAACDGGCQRSEE